MGPPFEPGPKSRRQGPSHRFEWKKGGAPIRVAPASRKPPLPPRAVVIDIDGTVTDYDRRLDLVGVRALRRTEARGIPVLTATGNVAPVARAFANFVGLTGPIVSENGGVVHDRHQERTTLLARRRHADQAVQHLLRQGLAARPVWSDPWRVSEVALQLNLDEAAVKQSLRGWNLDVVTTRFALHIMEPGQDKAHGLKPALAYLGLHPRVRPDQVLAIGDSNNDVRMLRECGLSGCVANGTDSAKRAARYVAKRRFGAGVKEILEHFHVL